MAATGEPPRVTRPMLVATEKLLDPRLTLSSTDSPLLLLGPARGVYLDSYGAVFTIEVNLISISPAQFMFKPVNTKEDVAQHKQKKLSRLPELRRALREALVEAAVSLNAMPPDEQIVIVAILAKYQWEDMSGVPLQIRVQATRKQLLELRKNDKGLEAAIHFVEE